MRARQLALEQHHFVVPRERHEVHVAQAPGVVLLADAGWTGLRRRLLLEPRDELAVACCALDRLLERRAVALGLLFEREQVGALVLDVPMPAIHRSRALPMRFTCACASNGGTLCSSCVSFASAAGVSGNG